MGSESRRVEVDRTVLFDDDVFDVLDPQHTTFKMAARDLKGGSPSGWKRVVFAELLLLRCFVVLSHRSSYWRLGLRDIIVILGPVPNEAWFTKYIRSSYQSSGAPSTSISTFPGALMYRAR